jgi:hypothetical protein
MPNARSAGYLCVCVCVCVCGVYVLRMYMCMSICVCVCVCVCVYIDTHIGAVRARTSLGSGPTLCAVSHQIVGRVLLHAGVI